MHDRKSHNHPAMPESSMAEERLDEIAGLLAAGVLRLHIRQAEAAISQANKNSSAKREKQLDAGARQRWV